MTGNQGVPDFRMGKALLANNVNRKRRQPVSRFEFQAEYHNPSCFRSHCERSTLAIEIGILSQSKHQLQYDRVRLQFLPVNQPFLSGGTALEEEAGEVPFHRTTRYVRSLHRRPGQRLVSTLFHPSKSDNPRFPGLWRNIYAATKHQEDSKDSPDREVGWRERIWKKA